MISDRAVSAIAIIVSTVWACSFFADVVLGKAYDPPEGINAVMMLVVGGAVAERQVRKRSNGGSDADR